MQGTPLAWNQHPVDWVGRRAVGLPAPTSMLANRRGLSANTCQATGKTLHFKPYWREMVKKCAGNCSSSQRFLMKLQVRLFGVIVFLFSRWSNSTVINHQRGKLMLRLGRERLSHCSASFRTSCHPYDTQTYYRINRNHWVDLPFLVGESVYHNSNIRLTTCEQRIKHLRQ